MFLLDTILWLKPFELLPLQSDKTK